MPSANIKGTALELAVRAIEEMVIKAQPGLAESPFSIERNVILTIDKVRHEIDLLVTINKNTKYETLHIFECKNRITPVSKNDVIILAEKIQATGAAKGTMVGRSFSKHAIAQAKKDRIALHKFDDLVWLPLSNFSFIGTGHNFSNFRVQLVRRSGTPETPPPTDWLNTVFEWENRPTNLTRLCTILATQWLKDTKAFDKPVGTYTGKGTPGYEFDAGELKIGDWEIQTMALEFDYSISLMPMPLVSTFSVETRGRFARFECIDEVSATPIAVELLGHPAT